MLIEEYNESWPIKYSAIKSILEKNLSKIQKIEHIGSTSIIGMCAKPIIDIDIIIDANDFAKTEDELKIIGYSYLDNWGLAGREAFTRNNLVYDEILDKTHHHLYVCFNDNEELHKHIFFRNYLNNNKDELLKYYNIKKEIINRIGNDETKWNEYQKIKEGEYRWFFTNIYKNMK